MAVREYTTFCLGDQVYALDILCVREINRALDITPVQHAPSFIRGLSNLRGQVITLFDLGERMGRGPISLNNEHYNIVLKTNEELSHICEREGRDDILTVSKDTVSFLVGDIGDVIQVDTAHVSPNPSNLQDEDANYLAGIIHHHDRLINLIHVGKVLEHKTNR